MSFRQGKKAFTVTPELTRRLANFKTLEDFRLAVSPCCDVCNGLINVL